MYKLKSIFIIVLCIAFTCCMSGCFNFHPDPTPGDQSSSNVQKDVLGDSLDNLVPLGKYADISSETWDAQIKIIEIIRESEANSIVTTANRYNEVPDSKHEYVIIKFNIKVLKLAENKTFSPYSFSILSNNGILTDPPYAVASNICESINIEKIFNVKFASEGTVDAFKVFLIEKDQERCLIYDGLSKCYFSLH